MEIRNNSEALKTLLAAPSLEPAEAHRKSRTESVSTQGDLAGDSATFSLTASEVSHSAAETEVRMDRVSQVQIALAAGTYSIPSSKIADKMIDAMLTGGFSPGE